jgi:hypothetical protein
MVPGLQANAETSTGATKFKEAVWAPPFKLAVTVTLWLVVTVPAVAVKEADVAPAVAITETGMVSEALLSESATTVPPVGADWFRLTVQVVEAPELTLGLHARAETAGATRLKVVLWEAPFRVAVVVAVWLVVIVPTVAVKVVKVPFAGTVTDAGTVSAVLLPESPTTVLAGAGWFRVMAQVLALPESKLDGLHCREARASGGTKVREVARELLPSEPVITAVCVVTNVPAVAAKPAPVCHAATTTEAGTVSAELLDDKVIVAPD